MLTTRPPGRRSRGWSAVVSSAAVRTLVAKSSSHASRTWASVSAPADETPPALLTSTSTSPRVAATDSTCSGEVRSTTCQVTMAAPAARPVRSSAVQPTAARPVRPVECRPGQYRPSSAAHQEDSLPPEPATDGAPQGTPADPAVAERAQALLSVLAGPDAVLRDDQLAAVQALVVQRRRVVVVKRTGWGKSAVYFLATRLLRDAGAGPTLLVSPLLSLMRDQIAKAEGIGIRAATINSTNVDDWRRIEAELAAGRVDLLLISPERLNSPKFRDQVLPELSSRIGLLVIDEAHCISDWGHDFRPDYRRLVRVLDDLGQGVPVLACTATANERVMADVAEQLGAEPQLFRGALDRDSLVLSVLRLPAQAERLAWLARRLPDLPGSGIVYCLTVGDAERVAAWLGANGIDARAYSGRTDTEERLAVEDALRANQVKVVAATSALGMGFDKPDLAFVVHFQSPDSPVTYYQQIGRAGRALDRAEVVLLCGAEDRAIWEWFASTAFPPREQVAAVLGALEAAGEPVSTGLLEEVANLSRTRLELMLKVLDVDGAVRRVARGWERTEAPWTYDADRHARVAAARAAEQRAMLGYATTDQCLMAFLRGQLDDPDPTPCGRCANCTGHPPSSSVDPGLAAEAARFLSGQDLTLTPRLQWPQGVPGLRGRIPEGLRVEPGRALATLGGPGWGPLVRDLLGADGPVPDE